MVYWTVACKGRTNAVFRQLNKELANNFSGGGYRRLPVTLLFCYKTE
jgi:hypothetical protein